MDLTLWCLLLCVARSLGYNFIPIDTQAIVDPRIPVIYDVSASQALPYAEAAISGFWASSFLTASDGSQYFLVSGLLASQSVSAYGASLLDLTTLQRNAYFGPASFSNSNLERFNFTTQDYEFSGLPPNNLDMKLRSNTNNVHFDVTVHATSPAFYYCGIGAYNYVNDTMYNWAFPASKTSGSIFTSSSGNAALERIDINPSASLTWYDRAWGAAELRNGNSTFFNLYFDNSDLILWTLLVDSYDPPVVSRSSNIRARGQNWHQLVPVDLFEMGTGDATWTSPRTGLQYPQEWRVGIEGRGELVIKSVVGDQEFAAEGAHGAGGAIYIGFATFEGVFDGESVTGFGGVELRMTALV
ncbi:uncharacterized protein APUU_50974A [Aspergillus puulaauensis]|uniref:Kievitone hydratase n=1 Tax=Aspergillus puulaauensis TaxID=1220207 RepID=A0A7R7XSW4_9EURO|nr:uncharacterized protein APUU_50974A [Aspergillus puulaauensis]BCS26263.1 hypothetical protein APUU_50974A [Aspergillus puulaauensis]